jgi:hypothetical protein
MKSTLVATLTCALAVSVSVHAQTTKPDALLQIDMNRTAVVERIVEGWKGEIPAAQLTSFRNKLTALRADHLLAANLSGSFDGVLEIVNRHEVSQQAPRAIALDADRSKAVGDPLQDLVYTPVTPCRLFDSRAGQTSALGQLGGVMTAQSRRTLNAGGRCGIPATGVASVFVSFHAYNNAPATLGIISFIKPGDALTAMAATWTGSNWATGTFIAGTNDSGTFDVFVGNPTPTMTADMVVDVTGYFMPANRGGNGLRVIQTSDTGLYTHVPNVVNGSRANTIESADSRGITIAGGGADGSNCWDYLTDQPVRRCSNSTSQDFATIGGGSSNQVDGRAGTIAGGVSNSILDGAFNTISGGRGNRVGSGDSTVSGGVLNNARGARSTVAGGIGNSAIGDSSTVSGGSGNYVQNSSGTVSGGSSNGVTGTYGTVAGGSNNRVFSNLSTVSGGGSNSVVAGIQSTVSGGFENVIDGDESTIAGGSSNSIRSSKSVVSGGTGNRSVGDYGVVGGGSTNTTYGKFSVVPGGLENKAVGDASFAAGVGASTQSMTGDPHTATFLWADAGPNDAFNFYSTSSNQFAVRSTGGVAFRVASTTNAGTGAGCSLPAGGAASWSCSSDRNLKESIKSVSPQNVLSKVLALPVTSWRFIGTNRRHIGPMAQDFRAAFGLGADDKNITTSDVSGVALAAIQGLNQKLEAEKAKNKAKEAEIAALKSDLALIKKKLGL